MNVSGEAVSSLVNHFSLKPENDLLIVVDDAAIPFGKFRLRSQGRDGGHNGLKSIIALLGTTHFSRLRFGIAPSTPGFETQLEAFVLSDFEKKERVQLPGIYERGFEASTIWATQPAMKAMNAVNASK